MSIIKIYLLCLCITTSCKIVSSNCIDSYMTICSSFEDLKHYKDVQNIEFLKIGNEHGDTKPVRVHLTRDFHFENFYQLTTLFIVRALSELDMTRGYYCEFPGIPLKHLTLYGNNLTTIEADHFPRFPLKTLSLKNNQIRYLRTYAFHGCHVEIFDISDNLIEVIPSDTLTFTNATRVITARNNRLAHIEPASFPSSLTSLNLDGNQLRYIQEDVLSNLVNLKQLTLSRNKFTTIPYINNLKQLIVFDISSNEIVNIPKRTIKNLIKLKLLDLSSNNIKDFAVLEHLYTPNKKGLLTISLALNRLTDLTFDNISLKKLTLVLYGNPWKCETWPEIMKKVYEHYSSCDETFYSAGNVPYCVHNLGQGTNFALFAQDDDNKNKLRDIVMKSEHHSQCTLTRLRYRWINAPGISCVG